jgi:hypothetical protein
MACCLLGALIIAHVLALRRRVAEHAHRLWLAGAGMLGVTLLGIGATQMAQTASLQNLSPSQALAWCLAERISDD